VATNYYPFTIFVQRRTLSLLFFLIAERIHITHYFQVTTILLSLWRTCFKDKTVCHLQPGSRLWPIWQNLAWWYIWALHNRSAIIISGIWKVQDGGCTPSWNIKKSHYLYNSLTKFNEILHGDLSGPSALPLNLVKADLWSGNALSNAKCRSTRRRLYKFLYQTSGSLNWISPNFYKVYINDCRLLCWNQNCDLPIRFQTPMWRITIVVKLRANHGKNCAF